MNKPNNDGMDLVEFLVLLLSQDDVTGFTFIMPGQNQSRRERQLPTGQITAGAVTNYRYIIPRLSGEREEFYEEYLQNK